MMRVEGYSFAEIAEVLGISESSSCFLWYNENKARKFSVRKDETYGFFSILHAY